MGDTSADIGWVHQEDIEDTRAQSKQTPAGSFLKEPDRRADRFSRIRQRNLWQTLIEFTLKDFGKKGESSPDRH